MTADSSSHPGRTDLAFQGMALHILSDALDCADRPVEMSSRVTGQIRTLTGARTVVLLQSLHETSGNRHRIVSVDPLRRRELAESEEVGRLVQLASDLRGSALWLPANGDTEAEKLLARLDCGWSIATPLRVGDAAIGCLLLLGLPEDERGIPQVVETLDMLSTVMALVFRTAILHERQEAAIQERTSELAQTNERLLAEITERKQVEKERERLIEQLEKNNAELERFAYTVSHDLKSPLITIKGFAGMLSEDMRDGDNAAAEEDLSRIGNAADKMDQLLREVLELSRIGRMINESESIPFEELIDEAVQLLRGQIEQREAEFVIAPDLPLVFGDRLRLLEVMQNLIDNALKYSGDQPRPRIEIGTRSEQDETIYYVRDNGMGIDPRYHEKIFGLFDQLDQKADGSGVGLALVKRIVEIHGGHIWVESEGMGEGATFCFTLAPCNQSVRAV